jgi:hypothetical protein
VLGLLCLGLWGASGCLLFTDSFNTPATVAIQGPGQLYVKQPGTFLAQVSESVAPPEWAFVPGPCPTSVEAADEARRQSALGFSGEKLVHQFDAAMDGCLFVIVVDKGRARSLGSKPLSVRARDLAILPPAALESGKTASFTASFRDEPAATMKGTFRWGTGALCADAEVAARASAPTLARSTFNLDKLRYRPFCLAVVAQDEFGAESAAKLDVALASIVNSGPVAHIRVVSPATMPIPTKAGLFTFFHLFALDEGELPEPGVTFQWTVTGPSAAEPLAPQPCPSAAAPGLSGPLEICFLADKPGVYHAALSASLGGMVDSDQLDVTVEDMPPCLQATEPNFNSAPKIFPFYDQELFFKVLEVRDDADPVPSAGRDTQGLFTWSRRLPNDEDFRPYVGSNFPDFKLSGRDFRPGDQVKVRVRYDDRFERDHPGARNGGMQCKPDDTRCEAVPGSGCYQSLTWTVVYL